MLKFVFIVTIITYVLTGVNLQHAGNQTIVFLYKEENESDFIVKKHEPLDIVLDNFIPVYVWCLNFNYTGPESEFVKSTHFNSSNHTVIHVPEITDEMITKWWCVVLSPLRANDTKPFVYQDVNYSSHNIVFNLHYNGTNERDSTSTSLSDTFDYKLICYITGALLLAIIFIIVAIILAKKCCCKPKTEKQTQARPKPERFYLNLEIFRREYERELQAQEPEYEEINDI